MSEKDREIARLAQAYGQYLNGPFGMGVLQRLKEGESFTIRADDKSIRITKKSGKASVEVFREPTEAKFLKYEPA